MEKQQPEIEIAAVKTADLAINPRNARKHSQKQIAQIAVSIHEFGFTNPILINEKRRVIAGHGRLLAAKELGLEFIPAIKLAHLSEAQERALAIADNKIALNSSWDLEILSEELEFMSAPDFEIEVGIIGFDTPEIDLIIGEPVETSKLDPADEPISIDRSKPAITQSGDLWICGKHRLYCGSALDAAAYDRLMDGEQAQMVITDPPYNVKIDGHVSGLGKARHQEFAMAAGEMTGSEFKSFLHTAFGCVAANSIDGALAFIFMDWRHMPEILAAGLAAFQEFKNLCVWNKTNGGMESLYRSKHELVFVFKSGTASHINNVELGRHGRYRTNVWDYAGANSFGRNRKSDLETHPTVKPVAMIADAIKDCSHRSGIVLDPFGGSGTTLIAAERTGRRARLIELDPYYVDVTIGRWQALTGKQAVHVVSGRTFDAQAWTIQATVKDEMNGPTPSSPEALPQSSKFPSPPKPKSPWSISS